MSATNSGRRSPKSQKITRRKQRHQRGTSEVGRFFQNLLKTEEREATKGKKKKMRAQFHSLRLGKSQRIVDAEALTAEERLSRLLHTPKPKIKLPTSGSLFDHFVVVGLPNPLSESPRILFQYPEDIPVCVPGLADFCFPGGVTSQEIPEDDLQSEAIVLLLHGQQYLKKSESSFVFLFTDQESEVYYGVCVHKEELFEEPPQYMRETLVPPQTSFTTTRCYCLITKYPFFRFHFDFLFSLFAVDHLSRLQNQAPTIIEDEKDEIDVFLSPLAKKAKSDNFNNVPANSKVRLLSRSDSGYLIGEIDDPRSPRLQREDSDSSDSSFVLSPVKSRNSPTVKKKQFSKKSTTLKKSTSVCNEAQELIHPCIDAMARFKELEIPQQGQEVTFRSSEYLNDIYFTRPFFDEEEELFAEWGLPLTLCTISFTTLCDYISAILLEKKILVHAESLRVLSALVLAFPPLIKPFTYQSVIIPMLPDKMDNFLEAPVPFVVGTINLPENIPDDVIIVNAIEDNVLSHEPIVDLPKLDELERKCLGFVNELKESFGGELPFTTTKLQRQLVDSICTVFETHFDSLFANFHNYTICDMSDPLTRVSVFMKDSFLDDIEPEEIPFLEPFIETQAFFEYSDHRLRRRDNIDTK